MYFPITIIDNFYEDFDQIKNFVNNIEFFKKQFPTMPGQESKPLNIINPLLLEKSLNKIMSVYYNRHEIRNSIRISCISKFDKMTPYGKDYNKDGWIHSDDNNKLSGILYIQGEYDEGTSIYEKKEINKNLTIKEKLYSGEKLIPDVYNTHLKEHNSQFKEILNIPCIPNRIVLFDSSMLHKSNGLGTLEKPRIIQTFFFDIIFADSCPIPEMKRY
jgi:hypothetical protein